MSKIHRWPAQIAAILRRCSSTGTSTHPGCHVKSSTECQGSPVCWARRAARVVLPEPVTPYTMILSGTFVNAKCRRGPNWRPDAWPVRVLRPSDLDKSPGQKARNVVCPMLYWLTVPSNTFDIVLASFLNDEPYRPRNDVPMANGHLEPT